MKAELSKFVRVVFEESKKKQKRSKSQISDFSEGQIFPSTKLSVTASATSFLEPFLIIEIKCKTKKTVNFFSTYNSKAADR